MGEKKGKTHVKPHERKNPKSPGKHSVQGHTRKTKIDYNKNRPSREEYENFPEGIQRIVKEPIESPPESVTVNGDRYSESDLDEDISAHGDYYGFYEKLALQFFRDNDFLEMVTITGRSGETTYTREDFEEEI